MRLLGPRVGVHKTKVARGGGGRGGAKKVILVPTLLSEEQLPDFMLRWKSFLPHIYIKKKHLVDMFNSFGPNQTFTEPPVKDL